MPISSYTNKTKCESSFSFHLCHLWHFIRSIILILIEASDRLDGQAWVLWSLRTGFESQFCLSLVIWGSFKGFSFGCALLNLGCDENTLRIIIVKIKWDDAYKSVLVVRSIIYISYSDKNISCKDGHNKGQVWYRPKRSRRYKKRCQEYTEELYKKDLHDPDNHNGGITHLEPDILEFEVKWALGSITMNKANGGDRIPIELFQTLKDDAVKVLHSICQEI